VENPQPDSPITILAETNFHTYRGRLGIKPADCRARLCIIGKTGIGKSALLANLARQDATNGEAFALLDPQSDLAEQVLSFLPEESQPALIYFNGPDTGNLLAFNSFEATGTHYRPLLVPSVITLFKSPTAVDLDAQVEQFAVLAIGYCHVEHPGEDGPPDVLGMVLTRLRTLVVTFALWRNRLAISIWTLRVLRARSLISAKAIPSNVPENSTDTASIRPGNPDSQLFRCR
jgi:hypothetical protein